MRPAHSDRGSWIGAAFVGATGRGFRRLLASSRRVLLRRFALALGCLLAISTLVASAVTPQARTTATARSSRPDYLRPLGSLIQLGRLPSPTLSGDRGTTGVPPGTATPPTVADPLTAAQEGPGIGRFAGSPGTLSPVDIAVLALEQGCSPQSAVTASAVAMAESGGSPSAQGDIGLMTSVWDWSAGLWQIRGLRDERGTGELRDSVANQDVRHNAAAMFTISQGCADWSPWSTYGSGAYQPFLGLAGQAVQYALAYHRAHGRYPAITAPDPSAAIPSQGSGGSRPSTAQRSVTRRHRRSRQHDRPRRRPASPTPGASTPPGASPSGGPVPAPTTALPLPTPTLPLPSSVSLPVPLPTSPLPTLPIP